MASSHSEYLMEPMFGWRRFWIPWREVCSANALRYEGRVLPAFVESDCWRSLSHNLYETAAIVKTSVGSLARNWRRIGHEPFIDLRGGLHRIIYKYNLIWKLLNDIIYITYIYLPEISSTTSSLRLLASRQREKWVWTLKSSSSQWLW